MDLVSVITPYYKKKKFIKEAILSVLNQTYQNLEVFIIYDDESLDDLDYIKEITSEKPRALIYIDDNAYRFMNWKKTMIDLEEKYL